MQEKAYKTVSIRVEPEVLDKFRYVAWYEGRSISGQLRVYIRRSIERHEAEKGPIPAPPRGNPRNG